MNNVSCVMFHARQVASCIHAVTAPRGNVKCAQAPVAQSIHLSSSVGCNPLVINCWREANWNLKLAISSNGNEVKPSDVYNLSVQQRSKYLCAEMAKGGHDPILCWSMKVELRRGLGDAGHHRVQLRGQEHSGVGHVQAHGRADLPARARPLLDSGGAPRDQPAGGGP